MLPEALVVGGVLAIGAVGAYLKYQRGGEVGADLDGDGDDDITVEQGDDGEPEMTADIPTVVEEVGEALEDIKGVGPARADNLRDAGFETAEDIYEAANEALEDVDMFGPLAVRQMRQDIGSSDPSELPAESAETTSDGGEGDSRTVPDEDEAQ